MIQRWASWVFGWVLAGAPASSAEVFYLDHDAFTGNFVGPVGPLVLSGDIEPGDYDRLLAKIAADQARFLTQNKIIVASAGGDVREALRIAALIEALHSSVSVGPLTGKCAGACFFIYVAAGARGADGEHLLGISRAERNDATPASPVQEKALREFLTAYGVPGYLAEEMFRHADDDTYWLTAQDQANLSAKSPAFASYLAAKCAWDEALERDANAGRRPIADLQPMWTCRERVTRTDAHDALAAALKSAGPPRPP